MAIDIARYLDCAQGSSDARCTSLRRKTRESGTDPRINSEFAFCLYVNYARFFQDWGTLADQLWVHPLATARFLKLKKSEVIIASHISRITSLLITIKEPLPRLRTYIAM
jgi:hypothetical protein